MKRFTNLILAVGALLVVSAQTRADDARDFTPKNGMFTISMPAGEQLSEKKVLNISGKSIPVEASETKAENGTTFTGGSVGIPATVMRNLPADQRFDKLSAAIAKTLGGKPGEMKDIDQDGVPGKEFLVETKEGVARVHLYTVAGWVMEVIVQGKTKEEVTTKAADTFFDSFKLSDKAKEVFKKVQR